MLDGSPRNTARTADLFLLLATVVFIYILLFKLPYYPFYFEADQLIFLYNADRMMAGERMYLDFFQFTFPGGQVLYVILFAIFGLNYWVLPLATLAMGAASFWFLLRASKLLIDGVYAYIPALLFTFFGFRWFGLDGSHRTFSPLFVLIAVYILLRGRTLTHLAAAGFFCALASYFTQQRGLVAVGSIGLFLLLDNYKRGWQWPAVIKESAALGGSFVISLAAMLAYFIVTAGWDNFVNATLVYPGLYYHFHEQNNPGVFLINFQKAWALPGISGKIAFLPALFYGFAVPLAVVAFLITYFRRRKLHDWEFWRGPVLVAFVTGFAVLSTTNPSFLRYYHMSAPSLILIGWMLHYYDVFGERRRQLITAAAAVLLLFAAFQAYRIQTNWDYLEIDAPRGKVYAINMDQIHRYHWLQERTRPGDPVFEVYEPFVYFLLGLRNPAGYTQIVPSDYTRPEFVQGALTDMRSDPPKFIIWNNNYNKLDAERDPGDHTGPLAEWVQSEYRPSSPVYNIAEQPIQIWERKEPLPSTH